MLDIIARSFVAISIMIGTTQLPSLSNTPSVQTFRADAPAKAGRLCPTKRDTLVRACMV